MLGRSSFSFIMFLKCPSFCPPTARGEPWEDSQAMVAESHAHSPLGPVVPKSCQHLSLFPERLTAHSFLAHQSNLQMTGMCYYCRDWDTRGGQAVTKFQGVASGPPWEGHMETDPHSLRTKVQQVQTAGAEARLAIPSLLVSTQEAGAPLGLLLLSELLLF